MRPPVDRAGGLHEGDDEMGSRNGWAEDLAKRCEDVGWTVTWGPGGHRRIKTHEGKVFSLASSTSDVHGQKNAERACARYGLLMLEERLKLQREKERLERLAADRENGVDWEEEERKIEEQKKSEESILGYAVGGVAILERVPARATHPRSKGKVVDIEHGMELGLADGNVIFECVYPVVLNNTERDCGRQFEAANSLRSHIAWHARKKPTVADEVAELGQEVGFSAARYKQEIIADMKPKHVGTVEEIEKLREGESMTVKMDVTVVEPKPGIVAELMQISEYADVLYDELGRVTDELDEVRRGVDRLRDNIRDAVKRVATENVDVDELRAKAAKFDAMMKLAQ
jgi:hypothetical protein